MKVKDGFMVRTVGGKIVAIAVGERSQSFNGMITLNETGKFIWKCLEKDTTMDKVVEKLMQEYGIDEATANDAANSFIDVLKSNDLLDD